MNNESRKWLYENLNAAGYNVGKNYEEFDSLLTNNEESRRWAYDTANSLGYNVGKDYAEFSDIIAPRAPKAEDINPTTKGGENGFTLTEDELNLDEEEPKKSRLRKKWEALKDNNNEEEDDDSEAIINPLTPEEVDEVAQQFRAEVGITPDAKKNATPNLDYGRPVADVNAPTEEEVQAALPAANKKLSEQTQKRMTTAGALDKAYQTTRKTVLLEDERKRLEDERNKVRERAANRRKSITTNAGTYQYGMAPITGNAATEINDLELSKLAATENQLNQAIREVDRKLSGEDVGFWQGFADATIRNPGFYTFGLSDMNDARALLNISENGVNSDTDRALLDATYTNSLLQADADRGFMYRAGNQLGHSLPFMIQMAVTGGGSGISNLGSKAAQKYATQTIKHRVARATGVLADDLLESAFIVNTAGAGSTQAKILQNKTGQLKKDAEGNYHFEGKEGWLEAAYKGEVSAILEMYTEKLGGHLDGKLSITKGLESIGASWLSKALTHASKSDIGKAANAIFSQFGINGVLPEVMEEEANIILNSIFVGDNKLSDLFDPQTQIDIVGGMFLSVGTMRAIPGTIGSAGYMYNQRLLNRADKEAEAAFGEKWPEMRERLNDATNENVAGVVYSMTDEENANVLLDYYKRMMIMRGYNIGTTKKEGAIPSAEAAYQEGYEAADEQKSAVKQAYDMERERALSTFGEEVVQQLDEDPIGTLAAMTEVDRAEAIDYVNAKTAYEGMIDRINADIDERIAASDKEIDSHKNRQDGAIHPAMMRGINGVAPKRVYIVNGNVATFEDGTIDTANSSSMIIVRDAETGEVSAASADDLESLDAVIDTETEKKTVAEQIANEYAEQQADIIETESEWWESLPTDNGEVTAESEVQPVVAPAATTATTEMQPAPIAQVPKTALEQIPRNENNIPLYEQVDSELAWDGVVEEAGGNEETAMVAVNSMVEDKKKALAAAEKAKAKAGATIAEKIAAENERVANIEKAKADLAKWEEIAGVKAKRAAAQAENVAVPVVEETQASVVETPQATNEGVTEEHPSVAAANSGRDTVGGSPVALAYLLEGGQGSILNAGYFLHGVAAAFPAVGNEIEALRGSMSEDVLGMSPTDFAAQRTEEIAQIGEMITNAYGEAGAAIYNELLNNASGFVPRVGAEVGARIEALQPLNESILSQTSDNAAEGGNAPLAEISNDERAEMEARIVDWLSEENLERAEGKTRDEIFDEFGNELEPIAYIPTQYISLVNQDLKDQRIYCGKGYFIDHALRNHAKGGKQLNAEDVDVSKYLNIQSVLDNPDSVKETYVDGKRTVVFIKKIGRYFAELTQVEEDGKIVLHKSMFDQKKEPYAKLDDIRSKETSSEGGVSSISHTAEAAPAISLESRGDVVSNSTESSASEDSNSVSNMQENTQKSDENAENGGENAVPEWLNKVPDDGRNFFVYVKFAGENKYQAIDLGKGETVDRLVRATMLQKEQLQALVEKLPSVLLEDAEFQIRDAKGNIYYNSGKVVAENEVAKQEDKEVAVATEDEFDIYLAEMKAAQERQKAFAQKSPRPSSFVEAYTENDAEAIKKLDKQFYDVLQTLVPMDIPAIEVTIKGMKERKRLIKDNETPAYKAFDHIEKALAKRKKQLEKELTEDDKRRLDIIKRGDRGELKETPQPKQENKPVESEPIKDEAPVTSETTEQPETGEVADAGPVNMETLQLNMSEEDFNALLSSGDKAAISEYLAEMDGLLRIGVGSPLDGRDAIVKEYRGLVEQYGGEENIPADVVAGINEMIAPYNALQRAVFDRKYALQDKLREIEVSEAQAKEQAEKVAKAEHKQTAFNGFLAGKSDVGASTAEKALSKKYNFDGKVMTVAKFVEDAVGNGSVKLSAIEEPKYKGASRATWNRMDARQQEADAKRVKESGTKTVYTVNDHDLGKTAYDYAKFLLDKKAELEKASQGERSKGKTESESKPEVEKIEDVGEVLAGARKDALKVLASSFENATVKSLIELPFSKAFKKPDLKKAVESGALREEDALFYEAMFNALINSSKPKNSARHRNAVETWAEETYNSLQLIKSFVEADEAARDRAMAESLDDKFPARAEELAVIEKRKVWNARNNAEWGDKTTPNPVWVAHEVLKALGYKPGDKVEIPFGVLKANVFATGYEFYNKKGERLIMQSVPTVEEGIENIVWLSKIKRGDADTMHPMSSFFATPTKRDMGDSGRYYVLWGTVRNPRRSEFGSIEEANAFAAGHKEAVVRPIQEVVKRYGYKLVFREPITGDKFFVNDMEFETEGEAMQYLEDNYDAVNEQTNELLAKERGEAKKEVSADDLLEVAMVRGKEGWKYAVNIKGKYANNMGMPLLLREFDTREDAKAFLNESKNEVFEIYKKQQAEQKKFVFFDTGENSRIGEDYRGGRDVTAKDFMDTFGFRGVQFGNWTNQEDRQMAVNQAYDAFMDLAKLLGVSPKALSLNGELGMAFGSRGSGFGNAHYEPGEIVINLTKTRGAGSLAHEWWHALDNYFARRANVPMGMVTDSRSIDMRPELRQAYNELLKMIEKSDFYKRSKIKGDYWGRMHEVTARLMAEWVDQSLKDRGELNTFLSRGVNEERYKRMNYDVHRAVALIKGKEALSYEEFEKTPEALAGFPYPSRAELKEFGDAMRNIFETVEEQETEEGDVVLYRSSEGDDARATTYDEAVQIVNDFNKTFKGAAKRVVISKGKDALEQQMREAGFIEESIEAAMEIYAGENIPTAGYLWKSDGIVVFRFDSAEKLYEALWHENTHRALRKIYGNNRILAQTRFDELPEHIKQEYVDFLKAAGYKVNEYAEETLCYFVGSRPRLIGYLKDGRNDLTSFYRFVDKYYKRFIDFAQNLIDYTVYHGEEIEHRERFAGFGEIAETTTEGGNGVHQRNSEIERDRTATTGGLTEEEIATLEAATGYTRDEIIEIFGGDLNRQGNGPLTDREVVMESDLYSKVLGKPRYYGKRQREFVARQRRRMAEKARQVAEKLNLNNVEVLESTEGLTGKKATSKGWFDPRTGKITVVVPNHGSTGDIVETVLHEAVAHYGLRKLFGENFKNFLDNVYRNVTPEIRAEITELAKKHGWDFHTATEEYLASLAENTNFEKVNPSLWSNIKSFFMKMLAKVGITLDEPLGDNELRYILWRSHQNLVNPGWFNVFGQAEDIAKQYELGVGNYASGEVKTESGEVAAEEDIRFREGQEDETMQQQYDRRVNGEANAWKEGWLDATRSVRVAQEAIEKELGVTIDDMSNVFDYMNTIPSINKNKMEVFEGKHQNPFLQLLSMVIGQTTQNGVVLDEKALERYANAKHGLERGREIAVKRALTTRENGKTVFNSAAYEDWREKHRAILANGKSWKEQQAELDALAQSYGAVLTDAAGLTAIFDPEKKMNYAQIVNESMKFIEDVEGALRGNNALTPFWEAIKGINEYILHEYFVGGLISKKQYDDLQDMYEYYVPLRGFSETTADERYDYVSERKSVLNSAVKNAYGRQSEAATIFATMLNMANSAIVYSSKNKVKQRLLNLAMQYQTPLLSVDNAWYVQQGNDWVPKYPDIREGMSEAEIQAAYQNYEAEMKELEAAGKAMKYKEGLNINYKLAEQWQKSQHAVSVMRNGREYIVYVNGSPKLAQAINGLLLEESHGWLLNASDKINHMRAKLVTGWSPSFVARNLFRDTQGSSVYYFAKYGFGAMREFQKNIRRVLPKIHGLYNMYKKGTLDENSKMHRYFKEFLENGGETGYTEMISIKDYEKKIKKMLKENSVLSMAEGLPGEVADLVEFANRGVENTCRFAAYVTSREAGVSVLQSIKDAKEVSVNFNRKGSGAKGNSEARKLYMFLNPAIQAAVQRIELTSKYPKRMAMVYATEFAMGAFAPILFSLLYGLLGGDDDEAEGNYYNLTNFMRRSNICLPLGDGVVTIPLSHESRVFYSLGEMAMSYINGHTEYDNIGLDLVNTFAQVLPLNPVEGWTPGESVEAILANFAPDPVKPLVEIYVNSNFAGAKIHNATDFTEHLPSQYRGLRNTGIFYQKASSMISGEYEKNWADKALGSFITPSSLEHLAQSYLGGLYTFVDETVKTAQWIGGSEEYADFRNVPILNSFYKSLEKYESEPGERTRRDWEKAFQHYYDAVEADADSEKTMNTRVKAKDAGAEVALTEAMERGDLLRIDIFNDGYDVIKDLYTEMDAAKQAKDFALVDELDKKVYAQKKFIVERMEQLADDPLSGYDMLTMKKDTPYGRLETYADVRDAKVISDFKSDLKDIYDGYDTAENPAEYEMRYGAEMDLYEELYDITRDIGKYKSYEDFNEEDMLFIRQERAAAIGLIDEYLKSAAKVNL